RAAFAGVVAGAGVATGSAAEGGSRAVLGIGPEAGGVPLSRWRAWGGRFTAAQPARHRAGWPAGGAVQPRGPERGPGGDADRGRRRLRPGDGDGPDEIHPPLRQRPQVTTPQGVTVGCRW